MKTLRLSRQEFIKLFKKPTLYIAMVLCIITAVMLSFIYNPTQSLNLNLGFNAESVAALNIKFLSKTEADGKEKLDLALSAAILPIENYASDKGDFTEFNVLLKDFYNYLNIDFYDAVIKSANDASYKPKVIFQTLKSKADLIDSTLKGFDNGIDFYFKVSDRDAVKSYFFSLSAQLQGSFEGYTQSEYKQKGNFIIENYLKKYDSIVKANFNHATEIILNEDDVKNALTFYALAQEKLETLSKEISEFVILNSSKSDPESMSKLRLLMTRYKSTATLSSMYLEQQFKLLIATDKSDEDINSFVGFQNFNRYGITEDTNIYKFIISGDKFADQYIFPFQFSETVGSKNTFGFAYFAMQITLLIVSFVCVYLASTTFAAEESSGSMRLLLVRPFKRKKIYNGKLLAIIYTSVLLTLISFITALITGFITCGGSALTMIGAFNANMVFAISPVLMLFIMLATQILSILFFVSIALFISVIFKSSIFSSLISFAVLIATYIFNALFSASGILKLFPFPHVDLFKFFGGANQTSSVLGGTLYLGQSIILSVLYLVFFILIMNLIASLVYRKKDF